MADHWRVTVERNGEHVVSIEPEFLSGREISDEDERAIETAARHLLSFIAHPPPPEREECPSRNRRNRMHAASPQMQGRA